MSWHGRRWKNVELTFSCGSVSRRAAPLTGITLGISAVFREFLVFAAGWRFKHLVSRVVYTDQNSAWRLCRVARTGCRPLLSDACLPKTRAHQATLQSAELADGGEACLPDQFLGAGRAGSDTGKCADGGQPSGNV